MKDDPRVQEFLERHRGWKIRRTALARSILRWANRGPLFRISNGPSRVIIMNCLFHHEKTPSMHMFINGTIHCYGCGTCYSWLDLIIELAKPHDVDELLFLAQQFVYSKTDGVKDQLLFDFMYT